MPKLASKNLCTGCAACASLCPVSAITMQADEQGFLMPVIDDGVCVSCNLCESICPVNNEVELSRKEDIKAFAAISSDEEARGESSSGGIFSLIAEEVLSDGGFVYGAAFDDNYVVKHIEVSHADELWKLRGSKYSQSVIGDTYKKAHQRIREGKRVLFSGSPCQVGGLRAYLQGAAIPTDNLDLLICVDFVCHSVPSPLAFEEYKKYRTGVDAPGEKISSLTFRSKEHGWSNYKYSTRYGYSDGTSYLVVGRKDPFMRLFLGGYICRESCFDCKFKGYERCSDITIADFWGVWDYRPELDDNKGTSLILVHNDKGEKIFSKIKTSTRQDAISLEEASAQNRGVLNSVKEQPDRDKALSLIADGRIKDAINLLPEIKEYKPSFKTKIKIRAKKLLGK